uniref:YtkA-like domain-containing protein n=1 Tax=Desulfatirhabdium butyrativorans TaxID=340467 RepID=A0A7C4MN51_9BACT
MNSSIRNPLFRSALLWMAFFWAVWVAFPHPLTAGNDVLTSENKPVWIGKDHYFTYSFSKKPQLGTVILKVELFDADDKRNTSLHMTGEFGMPSMPGHHDSGVVPFQLNKKGDYLLPLNIVMPGEWELLITILKEGKPIYQGRIALKV